MLTVEQLRVMSADDRAAYLQDCEAAIRINESAAEMHRAEERAAHERAVVCETRAAGYRAHRATLEAAGLWPLPATAD